MAYLYENIGNITHWAVQIHTVNQHSYMNVYAWAVLLYICVLGCGTAEALINLIDSHYILKDSMCANSL